MRVPSLIQLTVLFLALALISTGRALLRAARPPDSRNDKDWTPPSAKMDETTDLGELSHAVGAQAAVATGRLSLVPSRKASSQAFAYSIESPDGRNWIGVYSSDGGGPDSLKNNQDSLSWEFAPEADGIVDVSTANLPPGQYKAYFVAKDGSKRLAQPVEFAVSGTQGFISVRKSEPSVLTIDYKTPRAHAENWIGIFHTFGGGPESQERVAESLAWAYAPGESGTVEVNTTALQPGLTYRVYFLAMRQYKWLANPIDVFNPGQGKLAFITDVFKTQNARQGEPFKAAIAGMLGNPPDGDSKFAKAKDTNSTDDSQNSSWVKVSTDGLITGTPPDSGANTTFSVEALASDGSTARMRVTIPVVPKGKPLVDKLTVLSFNLWFGGTKVRDYHAKQARFIASSGADIVGLQESTGAHAIRLGKALGWNYWQGSNVGIISRYPVVRANDPIEAAGSVRIALDQGHELNFWNCHLGYKPYGPYEVCFDHLEEDKVLGNEETSRRAPQIRNIMSRMRDQLLNAHRDPVILTGDFNAPSHLDWTNATGHLHCGTGSFPWPTSRHPVDAGLTDSFREMHPDPLADPGITWSPIYLENEDEGRREPEDRIDFIYHRGLETLSSETMVVGKPKPEPYHPENEWPSDHAAVRTVFRVRRDGSV